MFRVIALMFSVLALCLIAFSPAAHPPKARSVLILSDEHGHGSGVHLGGGFVLTAAHVVQGLPTIGVTDTRGNKQTGKVLWKSEEYDLALVQIDGSSIASSRLSCNHIFRVGDRIHAEGSPVDINFATTWGRVSAPVAEHDPWKLAFMADMSVGPGMSGGPVFDEYGNVVGITVAVSLAPIGLMGASIYGESYIVPSTAACILMAEARR